MEGNPLDSRSMVWVGEPATLCFVRTAWEQLLGNPLRPDACQVLRYRHVSIWFMPEFASSPPTCWHAGSKPVPVLEFPEGLLQAAQNSFALSVPEQVKHVCAQQRPLPQTSRKSQ